MSLLKSLIADQKKAPQQAPKVEPAQAESVAPVTPPAPTTAVKKGLGLGLGLGAKAAQPAQPPAATQPKPATALAPAAPKAPAPAFDLDSLAQEVDESPAKERDLLAGEVPVAAIPRVLPADPTPEQLAFLENLDSLYRIFNDPEALGATCVSIMVELQENPAYEQMLADQDVRQLLIAARESMGVARIKKTEAKAKRSSRKPAMTEADAAAALFGDVGINFG